MNEHCSGAEVGARIEAAAPILASSNFARSTIALGGARRDRTDDLLLAKQALSQLSYGPGCERYAPYVVGLGRLELPTSRLSSARSNQLSYKPNDRPRPSPIGMRAVRARP